MFILNRTISFFAPLFIFLTWEIFFTQPKSIIIFGLIIFAITFFAFWFLSSQKINKEFWQFFSLPFVFISSSFLFSILLLPEGIFRHIFIVAIAFFMYLILESIFNFLYRPNIYQTQSIETFFGYLNLLIIFFLTSSFYNLTFFLNLSLWLVLIFFFFTVLFLNFYFFWVNKILTKENVLYVLIIALIMAEFFWVISFSPANFFVSSLILVLIYYLMVVFSKYHILKILNKKIIRQYLIIIGIALLLTLLTAQWR